MRVQKYDPTRRKEHVYGFLEVFPVDLPAVPLTSGLQLRACSQKSAECGEQHGYQMCDNNSLYRRKEVLSIALTVHF